MTNEFDRGKAIRELAKFFGCVSLIVAVVAIAYGPVKRLFNPPDNALQIAIKARDVEGVRRSLYAYPSDQISRVAYLVYRLSLENLTPSDPRSTEVLKILLEANPKPSKFLSTAPDVKAPDLDFTSRSSGSSSSVIVSSVELAARQCSPDGVRLLIRYGLTISSVAVSDALVASAANGCDPVIKVLLDSGADVNARSQYNDTPLAMARRQNNTRILTLLQSRGAKD